MDSTNPATLIKGAITCAQTVLSTLDPSLLNDMPECLFQFTLFLIMRTYYPKMKPAGSADTPQPIVPHALRFSMVRMEAPCKRLLTQR